MPFRDRRSAGQELGAHLAGRYDEQTVVTALPRGGVPVAAEVAAALGSPLDVLVVRKLGHPRQPELALGAIGEDGVAVIDHGLVERLGVTPVELQEVTAREAAEVERRVTRYRGGRLRPGVSGRSVVLVDDGVATGSTARAGIELLRSAGAHTVVLAVPVAPPEILEKLEEIADDVVCLEAPRRFRAVGQWYDDFTQVDDAEVTRLLAAVERGGLSTTEPGGRNEA